MSISSKNAYKDGDSAAGDMYQKAAAFTIVGGLFGVGGAYLGIFTLMGPAGIGALLILAGAVYAFEAEALRSTPFEVWLRRCCYGIPRDQDVIWQAENTGDLKSCLTAFNAIVNGMVAEVGFEGLSELQGQRLTKLEIHLSLPGCDEATSAWELNLTGGNDVLLTEVHNITGKENGREALPTSQYHSGRYKRISTDSGMEIRAEIWVSESRYTEAALQVSYWPDKYDAEYQLGLTVNANR